MRACLFQASEREHIAKLLDQPQKAAVLQEECAAHIALHAAAHDQWDRCDVHDAVVGSVRMMMMLI